MLTLYDSGYHRCGSGHDTLLARGLRALERRSWERAWDAFQQAAGVAYQRGDTAAEARAWHNSGEVQRLRGDAAGAEHSYNRAASLFYEANWLPNAVLARGNAGRIAHAVGDFSAAYDPLDEARALAERIANADLIAWTHHGLGLLYMSAGLFAEADDSLRAATTSYPALAVRIVSARGLLYRLQGSLSRSLVYGQQALQRARVIGDRTVQAQALITIGYALAAEPRTGSVAEHAFRAALDLRACEARAGLAALALAQGNPRQAANHARRVLEDLPAQPLDAIDDLAQVYAVCWQALAEVGDSKAEAVRQAGCDLLHARAANAADRAAYLQSRAVHRALIEESAVS